MRINKQKGIPATQYIIIDLVQISRNELKTEMTSSKTNCCFPVVR